MEDPFKPESPRLFPKCSLALFARRRGTAGGTASAASGRGRVTSVQDFPQNQGIVTVLKFNINRI